MFDFFNKSSLLYQKWRVVVLSKPLLVEFAVMILKTVSATLKLFPFVLR